MLHMLAPTSSAHALTMNLFTCVLLMLCGVPACCGVLYVVVSLVTFSICFKNGSIHTANSNPDNGHPWSMPDMIVNMDMYAVPSLYIA